MRTGIWDIFFSAALMLFFRAKGEVRSRCKTINRFSCQTGRRRLIGAHFDDTHFSQIIEQFLG